MNHADHRKLQAELLDRVLAILRSDGRVLGIVAAGSLARGEQDAFSDLDVGCFLRDEERTGRQTLYDRVGEVAPLLCRLWLYDRHSLYLFENGVRLDLDFYRPSDVPDLSHVYADARILHDPDGVLARSLSTGATPRAPEHPKWFQPGESTLPDWFFWMFRQIVCWAKRGAQGGPRAYGKLSAAADSLDQVRARLVEMRLWTLGVQDYLGQADAECARRLAQTYPHLDANELVACAGLLLDEYERICPPYCEKSRVPYPARKVAVMRRLITQFERLE